MRYGFDSRYGNITNLQWAVSPFVDCVCVCVCVRTEQCGAAAKRAKGTFAENSHFDVSFGLMLARTRAHTVGSIMSISRLRGAAIANNKIDARALRTLRTASKDETFARRFGRFFCVSTVRQRKLIRRLQSKYTFRSTAMQMTECNVPSTAADNDKIHSLISRSEAVRFPSIFVYFFFFALLYRANGVQPNADCSRERCAKRRHRAMPSHSSVDCVGIECSMPILRLLRSVLESPKMANASGPKHPPRVTG